MQVTYFLRNRYQNILIVLLTILAIIMIPGSISCNDNSTISSDINSETLCTLSIVDSIGIAQGDSNYVFGSVEDIDISSDGSIHVLDKIQLTIFVYNSDGEFIRRIGQPGNGPGDLDNPGSIAVLGDGSICVADGCNGWIRYDSSGQNLSTRLLLDSGTRSLMIAVDSTDIVGRQSLYRRLDDGRHSRDMTLCRWNASDPDYIISVYHYEEYIRASGTDIAQLMQDMVSFSVNPPFLFTAADGFVCVAPEPLYDPILLLFNDNGLMIDTLLLPYPEIPKTQEELEEEITFIEEHYNNLMSGYGVHFEWEWEPYPNHPMISSIGVDYLNRIWVQRGFEQQITFDLYNLSGEHLMTAVLPDRNNTRHLQFFIGENGIVAVPQDPISHYVIYLLSLDN